MARPAAQSVLGLLPSNQVLVDQEAWEWSGGFPARAVVFPRSTEEVEALVRVAAETDRRLLPAGGGSWLVGGGWARESDVILSVARLDGVHHYEPADLTLTAGAGLTWDALEESLAGARQWLPWDPPGVQHGTLGGAVASGISGSLGACYGAIRDTVLGMRVVTGEGKTLDVGGRVVKNVAGFDMVRLLTGSRGSLGVITRVSVRLFPEPQTDATLLFRASVAEVVTLARAVCTCPWMMGSVEIVEDGGPVLAVRLLGGDTEVDAVGSKVTDLIGVGPDGVLLGGESRTFHQGRRGWEDGSRIVIRISALPAKLPEVVDIAMGISRDLSGEISAHASQGLVRVKGDLPPSDEVAFAVGLSAARRRLEEMGGSLSFSRAPEKLVARVGWTGGVGSEAPILDRIKSLFDPRSVLAAGRP